MDHHKYAMIFPMLDTAGLQRMADDIAENGLRNPIVIDDEDQILDGRNRQAACELAGVEPVYEPFVGSDEQKLALVVSANLHRRHLTTNQKAKIAASLLPSQEQQAAGRQKKAGGDKISSKKALSDNCREAIKGDARDKAGAAMNVSGKAVDMAAKVYAKAVPEIGQAVDRGELSVSAAAIVADMPRDEQKKIAADGPKAVKEAASKVRKSEAATVRQDDHSQSVAVMDDSELDDEPFDVTETFHVIKDEVRRLVGQVPMYVRQHVWDQLVEQLNEEDVSTWSVQ